MTLTVRDGKPCVELEDHAGELWSYAFEVRQSTPRLFSVLLVKSDGDPGTPYLVQIGERWHSCDCPHFRFRREVRAEGCKHCRTARELRPLLAMLGAAQAVETKVAQV